MPTFVKKEADNNKTVTVYYADVDRNTFSTHVRTFFESSGYKLIGSDGANGIYEKGNRTTRLLLGAFYKYFKFQVYTEFNGSGEAKLTVLKSTSGMSGGAIGVQQVKKEMKRIEGELEHGLAILLKHHHSQPLG